MEYQVVGTDAVRLDAVDKVTGQGLFVADIKLSRILSVAVVRSISPHAIIDHIDMEGAAIAGVYAVVTGEGALCVAGEKEVVRNSKKYLCGSCIADQPPMALGKVRYAGEPVAAVVAESIEIASRAAEKVAVHYLPLPHVLDPEEAIEADAPIIHEDLGEYRILPTFKPEPGTNVYHHYVLTKGHAEPTLDKADYVFTHEFFYPHVSHAQLEPHGCIAHWERSGELSIHCSSQSPWYVRAMLAKIFDIPYHRVKVTVPYVGGGFGGKSDVTVEPLTAYIASFVPGYPVRYILTREEMFVGSVVGRGCRASVTTGVGSDGKITAVKTRLLFQGGAYGDSSINIVTAAGHNCTGPYEIENVRVDSLGVYTNTPCVGAFRGYGHPEVHWMMDRNLEIIAHKLGVDPWEFKVKNLLQPGSENALGQVIEEHDGRLRDCAEFVYREVKDPPLPRSPHGLVGYGFTPFMKSPVIPTNAASCATLRFEEDASVTVAVSAIDMGQGSTTALAQIAAEALRLPLAKVRVVRCVATEYTPYEWQTVASRTTWTAGNAVLRAVENAVSTLKGLAAAIMSVNAEELEYDGQTVFAGGDPTQGIPLRNLCMGHLGAKGQATGGPIIAYGYYIPPGLTFPDPKTGQGNVAGEWTFGCQGVVVEIDRRTGQIDVRKMVTAIDAGKIINPVLARGQVVGAMVQALGAAMMEAIVYGDNGRIRNSSFTDYKIPACQDFVDTEIVVEFLETPFPKGPFGARCLAEHGTVGIAAALGNAIFKATGIDFYELPITAERLLMKMKERERHRCAENLST